MGVILPGFRFLGETGRFRFVGKSQGGGGFSPLSLSPVLWLDFSDLTTLFQDSAGTTPVTSDGDVIGYAADKSGNGNHATQGTTLNKPLWKAAIQNGLGVARFDGSNSRMVTASFVSPLAQPNTIICVGQMRSAEGTTGFFYDGGSGARHALLSQTSSTPDSQYIFSGTAGTFAGTMPKNSTALFAALFNSPNSKLWTNTSLVVSGASGTNSLSLLNVGIGVGNINPLLGDIMEILIFNSALSDANRGLMETYLNDKWAVF